MTVTNPTPISKPRVAYYCMEYGLDPSFTIYSGGLGVLAGDLLKAAHDADLPMVALGILWDDGYTLQTIDESGHPVDAWAPTRRDHLHPLDVTIDVTISGQAVPLTAWLCTAFNNVPLYLLEPKRPEHRHHTKRLYQGGPDARIIQEIILGIGGVRLLNALNLRPDIHHFNEGHAILAGFELIAQHMTQGDDFETARAKVRPHILFTTHTPVPAGNEEHLIPRLIELGADICDLGPLALENFASAPFNMTVAGIRLSSTTNAVSKLHAEVAHTMWHKADDYHTIVPVTNGVHQSTWQHPAFADVTSPEQLWEPHLHCKQRVLELVNQTTGQTLSPEALTIGFARRAATYKRADLALSQLDQLIPLFEQRQLQFVFSGKAHPDDTKGKHIISRIVSLSKQFPDAIVYIPKYDMTIARTLVQGVDLWLNTPIRPREASGTSGMKAAFNAIPNFSIPDGWWAEAANHGINGWSFGGFTGIDIDHHDATDFIHILTTQILPTWRDKSSFQHIMYQSLLTAKTHFSASRMLSDYQTIYSTYPTQS